MLSMVSLSFVPSSCIGDEVCSWSNISIVLKKQSKAQTLSSKQGNLDRGRRGQKTTTPILSLPRGAIRTGRLTAVMGPSGSGKSTFLNIISERFHNSSSLTSYSDVQHRNDLMSGAEFSKRSIAFIHQDDAFFSMLTVNETLELARNLKIVNEDILIQEKGDLSHLLNTLNLVGIASSRVGDVDDRGISGGERKRLSVALQLLGNPMYLIADEPTRSFFLS